MIILKQVWGHLGDNLQLSTIPEAAYNHYGKKCVYISNHNVCSNQEIKKLIWDMNPYIAGFTDQDASFPSWQMISQGHIASIENSYGLPPISKYPKIYYNFNDSKKDFYKNKIFIDLTSSSENSVRVQQSINKISEYFNNFKPECEVYQIRVGEYCFAKNFETGFPMYTLNSLFEYCDLIKYCYKFIGCWSGLSALVSAIKRDDEYPKADIFISPQQYDNGNGLFNFKNLNYIV